MRIDIWLVENAMASSRQKAQELINSGRVVFTTANGETKQIKKSSTPVDETLARTLRVESGEGPEFVSRGGLKLFGALKEFGVSVKDKTIVDFGISTGGFADCCLQLAAKRVVGIDVGHGQLAPKLRADPRVTLFEGVNARELSADETGVRAEILAANENRKFEVAVVDVSFISLKMVVPSVVSFLGESGHLVALVKPQFEVGREGIGRNGIVKDSKLYPRVESSVRDVCASLGLKVESYIESPILGSDGNREFFIHATVPQLGLL